jgi:hypothetical protein
MPKTTTATPKPKGTFYRTVTREVRGEEYTFHAFTDARMIHVYGRGDARPESTGKPFDGDSGELIISSLVGNLLTRGTVQPGKWEVR